MDGGNIIDKTEDIKSKLLIKLNFGDNTNYDLQTVNTLNELHFLDKEIGIKIFNNKNYTGFIIWGLLDFNNLDPSGKPKYYSDFGLTTKRSGFEVFRCGTTVIRCTDPAHEDTYGEHIKTKYHKYYSGSSSRHIHPSHCFKYFNEKDSVIDLLQTKSGIPHARLFETIFCNDTKVGDTIPDGFHASYIECLRKNNYELLITGLTKEKDKEWEIKSGTLNYFDFYDDSKFNNIHKSPKSDLEYLLKMVAKINSDENRLKPELDIIRNFFKDNSEIYKLNINNLYILNTRNKFIELYNSLNDTVKTIINTIDSEIFKESKIITNYNNSDIILINMLNKLIGTSGLKNGIISTTLPTYTINTSYGSINVGENNHYQLKEDIIETVINFTQSYHITKYRNKKNRINLLKSEPLIITDIFQDCVKRDRLTFEFNSKNYSIGLYLIDVDKYNISCVYSNIDNIDDDHMYFIDFYNNEQRDIMFDGLSKTFNLRFTEIELDSNKLFLIGIELYKSMITDNNISLNLNYNLIIKDLLDLQKLTRKIFSDEELILYTNDIKHIVNYLKKIDISQFKSNMSISSLLTYLLFYSTILKDIVKDDHKITKFISDYLIKKKKMYDILFTISNYIFIHIKEWNQSKYQLFYQDEIKKIIDKKYNDKEFNHLNPLWPKEYNIICNKDCVRDLYFTRFKNITSNINNNYIPYEDKKMFALQALYCGNINIESNFFAILLSKNLETYTEIDFINFISFLFNNDIIIPNWEKKYDLYVLIGQTLTETYEILFHNKNNIKLKIINNIIDLIVVNQGKLKRNVLTNDYSNINYDKLVTGNYNNKYITDINLFTQLETILYQVNDGINDYNYSSICYMDELIGTDNKSEYRWHSDHIFEDKITDKNIIEYNKNKYLISKDRETFKSNLFKFQNGIITTIENSIIKEIIGTTIINKDKLIIKNDLILEIDKFIEKNQGKTIDFDIPPKLSPVLVRNDTFEPAYYDYDYKHKYMKYKIKYINLAKN